MTPSPSTPQSAPPVSEPRREAAGHASPATASADPSAVAAPEAAGAGLSGKNVLLTGGTGFVGRHLLPQLLAAGARVTCLVRATSRTDRLPQGVATAQADLATGAGLAAALKGQVVCILMAAMLFGLGWQDYLRANALAARTLAQTCTALGDAGPARVVLVSSLAATGPCATAPGVADAMPPAPVSAYGWSKLLAEQILGRALGERLVTLRPPIIYGSGDKGLLPVFQGVRRGLAVSPGAGRDFPVSAVHAEDMAQAVLCACKPQARGVYHLSDGGVYTMGGFCQVMGAAVRAVTGRPKGPVRILRLPLPVMALTAGGCSALACCADALLARWPRSLGGGRLKRAPNWNLDKYREARQVGWLCDNSRLCRELGFAPQVGLEAGMQEAAEGYHREGRL